VDLFYRQARFAEYDLAEMSLSTYATMLGQGNNSLIAIPVFPSRHFRLGNIYVHRDSGIDRPEDMIGKNVGILEYQMTAAVWLRGFLAHEFDVYPRDIHWWSGGLVQPGHVERLRHEIGEGVEVREIPSDRTLEGMLEQGELDALMSVKPPAGFAADGSGTVRRLFRDYRKREEEYFARTGIFPIMHTVVIRRALYDQHRWIALSLLRAFEAAKGAGMARMREFHCLAIGHPWLEDEIELLDSMFDGDPFPYGFERNRQTLATFTRYLEEQGLCRSALPPEQLFCPETLQASLVI
jgi:4,5-dihydroxyphthalate decarboxylase